MMLLSQLVPVSFILAVAAQDVVILTGSSSDSATSTAGFPTGTYPSVTTTQTFSTESSSRLGSISEGSILMGTGNITGSPISTSTNSRTQLVGSSRTSSTTSIRNATFATSTSTTSSILPTNTQPCNGYSEFCNRKYSNITNVMAHNSPFVGNSATDNQELPVTTQLNDGIRGLQAQAHKVNDTIYLCHSSCDLFNAGTLESYLNAVTAWVQTHPYDVITILLGNADYSPVTDFVTPIQASGISQYLYEPPVEPMTLSEWPTLGSMILSGKRVVMFMDYQGNQTEVPYILVEFSQMWETPFDPTDRDFPCTLQRPPDLETNLANERLYIVNHNLNQNVSILGISLSVPNKVVLPETNNVSGYGSLGLTASNCDSMWGRPPTFLNVDYYNNGSGTVFEVAATWNNVSYMGNCCGLVASGAERMLEIIEGTTSVMIVLVVGAAHILF